MFETIRLAFYDFQCDIRSDSRTFLEAVEQFHGRFVIPVTAQDHEPPLFVYSTRGDRRVVTVDDRDYPMSDGQFEVAQVYMQLLQFALARVHSHLLIHAGVVSRDGKGVLLVADSMHGKSTLVLELVRRGFAFLSDEIAALCRSDNLVHPYPRAVSIRPQTFDLLGLVPPSVHANWYGKYVFDLDELFPNRLGGPVAVEHLILLTSSGSSLDEWGRDADPVLLVNRVDDAFLADLSTMPGVDIFDVDADAATPAVRLVGDVNVRTSTAIAALCRRHGVLMLNLDTPPRQAGFATEARLEPVSTSQAIFGLIRSLHAGYHTELVHELGSARIFSELATVLQNAQCHRLQLGPVQQNADLICDLFSE